MIKTIKFKNSSHNSFLSCKISTFNFFFLGSLILYKLRTTASFDQRNFGFLRHRNINNNHMKDKVTFFLNNIKTQLSNLFQQQTHGSVMCDIT